ncbi:YafY family protein [Microbispora sp. GKU 823]|uniref:helix-turn-helix transcriptional regulator n=1 Tax=Microbispora sp. GKU 823 TaxID=1652100 RepID=UPI002117D3C4|nr:WYL domain-containing protein [Microbispora sp. GKU 823]
MVGLTTRSAATARPSGATLLTLADAARRRLRVRLAYRSYRGQDSERTVDPYGLVFHSGRWYLTGHDHRRGEVRTFRLDRIGRAETTEEGFPAPGEFDAVAHVIASLASVPYRYEVEVVLATTMEEARRRIPPTVAALAPADGGVRMTGRAERLDGMAQVLSGLGVPFTVVGPPELREEVRALARRLQEWAGQGPETLTADGGEQARLLS